MLVGFSPFRVSLLGGGTDIEEYYSKFGCRILGLAINYGCLVTLNTSQLYSRSSRYRIVYADEEITNDVKRIKHPLVREFLVHYNISSAELHFNADLPAVSGLGTSSAFANTLSGILSYAKGEHKSGEEIAQEAIWMERKKLCEAGGIQDQIISATGGLCEINADNNGWKVSHYQCDPEFLKSLTRSLVLVRVGWSSAPTRSAAMLERNAIKSPESLALKHRIKKLTEEGFVALENHEINQFGKIVDMIWEIKSKMPGVTSFEIDECYEYLKRHGAYGCRLLGAGGRGFVLGVGNAKFVQTVLSELGPSRATTVEVCSNGTRIWET